MGAALLIMFREAFEAALVIGMVAAFVKRSRRQELLASVWAGLAAGVALSAIGALLFSWLAGGFEGAAEQVFEGMVMLAGAVLLTSLIFWLHKGDIKKGLEEKAAASVKSATPGLGIFLIVLVAVLREGIETVLFLGSVIGTAGIGGVIGSLIGLFLAVALGLLLFWGGRKIPLRVFFPLTNLLLVLFAAGLFSNSLHEFSEAGLVPVLMEKVYDLSGILDHHEGFGAVLRGLFGYSSTPDLVQIIGWVGYVVFAGAVALARRKPKAQAPAAPAAEK